MQMQMLAWQTSLLMNSTGNFKKKIKPSDLYNSMKEVEEKKKPENTKTKEELQADLLKAFASSNLNIQ